MQTEKSKAECERIIPRFRHYPSTAFPALSVHPRVASETDNRFYLSCDIQYCRQPDVIMNHCFALADAWFYVAVRACLSPMWYTLKDENDWKFLRIAICNCTKKLSFGEVKRLIYDRRMRFTTPLPRDHKTDDIPPQMAMLSTIIP